jgi:hypothetical protein
VRDRLSGSGGGRALDPDDRRVPNLLDMVTSRTFDNRILLLEYVPRVLDGPRGADAGS